MADITQFIELGGIAGLFALFITQYFQTQKAKKDPMNGTGKAILNELQTQNNNHLHSMEECMSKGFDKMAYNQNETNKVLYEILGILKAQQK